MLCVCVGCQSLPGCHPTVLLVCPHWEVAHCDAVDGVLVEVTGWDNLGVLPQAAHAMAAHRFVLSNNLELTFCQHKLKVLLIFWVNVAFPEEAVTPLFCPSNLVLNLVCGANGEDVPPV